MSAELFHQDEQMSEVLQQVSSQLRLSLGNIHSALTRLAPPDIRDEERETDLNAAVLCQSYYRILRLTNNLSDASEPERPEGQGMDNDDIVGVCRTVMEQAAETVADSEEKKPQKGKAEKEKQEKKVPEKKLAEKKPAEKKVTENKSTEKKEMVPKTRNAGKKETTNKGRKS